VVLGVVALALLIQLVPYGRSHGNPPVTRAVRWDSPRTAALFKQACQDCHSNLSSWRWYDQIAPASWLVEHDIQDGRQRLNVSEWNRGQPDVAEVMRAITGGSMPPLQYKLVHAEGRLSKKQRQALAAGIAATYKKDPPPRGAHHPSSG
jgi:mono/diheme cytochrome c family protein